MSWVRFPSPAPPPVASSSLRGRPHCGLDAAISLQTADCCASVVARTVAAAGVADAESPQIGRTCWIGRGRPPSRRDTPCARQPARDRGGRPARPLAPAQAQEKVVKVYNWSDYIDPAGPRGVHRQDRHQGRLRRLRQQRGAGDQAARRQHRLRPRGADRLLPGRGRSRPASSSRSTGPRSRTGRTSTRSLMEQGRQVRPGQRARLHLHVGHHRARLQRRQGQGADARRAARFLGAAVRPGRSPRSSPTAAS